MCIQNGLKDGEEKPKKAREYYCWSHDEQVHERDYAKHDRQNCQIEEQEVGEGEKQS